MRRAQIFQEIAGGPTMSHGHICDLRKLLRVSDCPVSVLITGLDEPPFLKPSVTANSKPYDRVDGEHELAAARAVIPRPRTPGIFVPDFGTSGDQLVEVVSDSHGVTRVSRYEARPLAFLVVQNV